MDNIRGKVKFHFLYAFNLTHRLKLKSFISGLMAKEKKSFNSIDYIFCSDEYLSGINREYLQHDDLTDIITFDLSEPGKQIRGEVYISVERVRDNAAFFNSTFTAELHRVMFHGALHLCGYKDKHPVQKKEMREKEDFYLRRYF